MISGMEAFWSQVRKTSRCWEWQGSIGQNGYGRVFAKGAELLAHRLAWTLINGPIPPGLSVMHACDNKICVRPTHLMVGTQAANIQDMWHKGRGTGGHVKGTQVGTHKLTEAQVREIRRLRDMGVGQRQLAHRFGVSKRTIQFIEHRVWWKHVA